MPRRQFVAFEIGSSAVKKIQVDFEAETFFWNHAEKMDLREKEDAARRKEIARALGEWTRDPASLAGAESFYIFNSPQSFVREFFLPKMPLKELDQVIQLQLKKEAPFPVDEVRIDYHISDERPPGQRDRLHLIVSAVSKKILEHELALFKEGGWMPKGSLHTPFSIRRFSEILDVQAEDVFALIDIGARATELNIYQNFELKFARKINLGGDNITEALASPQALERMGLPSLDSEGVEKLKRTRGLVAEHPADTSLAGFQPMQYLSAVRSVLERFQNEIARSFNFFSEEYRGKTVKRIFLMGGGGALLQGLGDFLQKRLQTPVGVLNLRSTEGVKISDEVLSKPEELPRYDRMLLTLASWLEEKRPKPSFSLEAYIKSVPRIRWIQAGAGLCSFVILVIAGNLLFLSVHLKALNSRWKKMAVPYDYAKGVKELENEVLAKRNSFNLFFTQEPYWEDVFRELSHLFPENFRLERLAYNGGILTMSGTYFQDESMQDNLPDFLMALSKGVFKNPKLVATREVDREQRSFSFEISCQL